MSTSQNVHAQEWRTLAIEQERQAAAGFVFPAIATARADLYRRTARAIELSAETGQWHCACCVKPVR